MKDNELRNYFPWSVCNAHRTSTQKYSVYFYLTQVQLCATQKPMLERQMLAERKVALIRKPDHLGRRQTPVPKTNSDESARP